MKQSFLKLTSQVFQEFQVLNLTSDNESLQRTPEFLALFTKTRSRSVNTVPEELWEENNVTNCQVTRCSLTGEAEARTLSSNPRFESTIQEQKS